MLTPGPCLLSWGTASGLLQVKGMASVFVKQPRWGGLCYSTSACILIKG